MATELYIPKMSDHMEQAVFVEWLAEEGDRVEAGQPLVVIETDKVTAEIPSPASGYLANQRPGLIEGAELSVGEVIAYIVDDLQETIPPAETRSLEPSEPPPAVRGEIGATGENGKPAPEGEDGSTRATPAARRLAREVGVDLSLVNGTGPGGRVAEEDVRAYADEANNARIVHEERYEGDQTQ